MSISRNRLTMRAAGVVSEPSPIPLVRRITNKFSRNLCSHRSKWVAQSVYELGRTLDASEYSGYDLARMRFEIILAPEAIADLRKLKANLRTAVREALETHLKHEPAKANRSRIKRLRGLSRPQYRLRVEEVRMFYDVSGSTVEILAIVAKSEADLWLTQFGSPE